MDKRGDWQNSKIFKCQPIGVLQTLLDYSIRGMMVDLLQGVTFNSTAKSQVQNTLLEENSLATKIRKYIECY